MANPDRLPLILLPGLVCDDRLWSPQVEALSDLAEIFIGDLTGSDSMQALAASVLAKAPQRFALAGLSMGGYVALEIMRQAPARVIALGLLDTSARPDTAEATGNRRNAMQRADSDFEGVIRDLVPKLVTAEHLAAGKIPEILIAMGLDAGAAAFKRQQTAIIGRPDSRPSLGDIACPTLVLCGDDDVLTPPEVHEEMADLIPDARLIHIPACGHASTLSRPDEVNGAMRVWLEGALRT